MGPQWRPRASSAPQPEEPAAAPVLSRRALAIGGVGVVGVAVVGGVLLNQGDGGTPPAPTPTAVPPTDIAQVVPPTAVPTVPATAPPVPTATPDVLSPDDAIVEATVADLRDLLDSGKLTVTQLVQASLDRIAMHDTGDNGLGAVIETNPDALSIAAQLDTELRSGAVRSPLHGIPVVVKDVFASADQMKTANGSLALAENTVVEDGFLIKLLRDAGVVLLGKANMSEWAGFRSSGLASGWSGRGGQTRNPYIVDMSPWGSSSGSAVAVAASYVPLALGAETDGSILCPAAACGVVGLKPTIGVTSRTGVLPLSFAQDSPGPMGRTVRDVAAMMQVIAGYDPEDPANGEYAWSSPAAKLGTNPVGDPGTMDYTSGLNEFALHNKRVGIARSLWGFDANADAVMEAAIERLTNAGVQFVDGIEIYMEATSDTEYTVLITEFPEGVQRFLDRYMPDGPIRSIADVIAYNEEHADMELQWGDQVVLERALQSMSIDDPAYRDTLTANNQGTRDDAIDAVMDQYQVDVLIAPTVSLPAPISPGGDVGFNGASAQIPAVAGYPSLNLPIGMVEGLPVGMNIFGRAYSEKTLLEVAYGFEQILQAREAPQFVVLDPQTLAADMATAEAAGAPADTPDTSDADTPVEDVPADDAGDGTDVSDPGTSDSADGA
ncbi:MAG: amidase family protein [Thermomicrobiales bacterium]